MSESTKQVTRIKVRPRCPKCKLKIRGKNHDAHCVERAARR